MRAGSRVVLRIGALVLGTGLLALDADAQNFSAGGASNGGRSSARAVATAEVVNLKAVRRLSPIVLDGKLDEEAWKNAPAATEFTQSWPNPGKTPTEATDVRVLYDGDAIYVGARMFDSRPDSIAAQLARRDMSAIYSDWLHIIIDSYHDRRTAFRFTVNPKGVMKDVFTSNDNNEDTNWDAVWEVKTRVDSLGWTAEYRIPLSQLRFGDVPKGQERLWGFQIMRDIARSHGGDVTLAKSPLGGLRVVVRLPV